MLRKLNEMLWEISRLLNKTWEAFPIKPLKNFPFSAEAEKNRKTYFM